MIPLLKYNPTNWVDGMKISRQHFMDSEIAAFDAVRDAAAIHLNSYSYGILPPLAGEKLSLDIKIVQSQADNFIINVPLCRAVTAGGCRIEITPLLCKELVWNEKIDVATAKKNNTTGFYILISVNPHTRVPAGQPNPQETPPRHPYTLPEYKLHVAAADQITNTDLGTHFVIIGKLKLKNDELQIDNTYIPPCCTVHSHHSMIQVYNTLGNQLNTMQLQATGIAQKVINKNQTTALAKNVQLLCEKTVYYTSSLFFPYRMKLYQQSPLEVANCLVQMANTVKVAMDFIPEKEKEELQQYFKEWNEITAGRFDELIAEAIELEYQHEELYDTMQPLVAFSTMWSELLEKLNELELIGRRKDKDLFVREMDTNTGKPPKKKGFSMLD